MNSDITYNFILERVHYQQTIVLDEPGKTYTCGRGKENQILCLSLTVSRQHCSFFRNKHEIYVIDLGSSNGVFVNEVKQKARHMVKLNDNDVIGIGCPRANDKNSDMYIYKLHFVLKDEIANKQKHNEQPQSTSCGDTLTESIDTTYDSVCKRKAKNEPSHLAPLNKKSKLSQDMNISCQVKVSDNKLNSIDNKVDVDREVEIIYTPTESTKVKLDTLSSDTRYNNKDQRVNNINNHKPVCEKNSNKYITKQDNLLNDTNEVQFIKENEVIFIDPPSVIDTEILQQNYDNDIIYTNNSDDISTRTDVNDIMKRLPQQNCPENETIYDKVHNNLSKDNIPSEKSSKLNKSMDTSTNIMYNGSYYIKMENELIINDDDEEAIRENMINVINCGISPIKLKQIKQEPKLRFSELDIVNLSDDGEDVFPCSQLFDSGLNINSHIKEEIKQEFNDNRDEDINRLDDTEIIISLSDSDDEDNVWLHRLSQSQLFNDTLSNNDKANDVVEIVKDEDVDLDAIDNDLKNIVEESNENAESEIKTNNKLLAVNKIKKKKVEKHKSTKKHIRSSEVSTLMLNSSDISIDANKIEENNLTNSPTNTTEINKDKSTCFFDKRQNTIDPNTTSENILNCAMNSAESKSMIKKGPQIIDPPHMPVKKTRRDMGQCKKIDEVKHKKTAQDKKKSLEKQKLEEYAHLKEQKRRRTIHAWANCLPPSKIKKTFLSKEEKKELIESRKNKLKKIATEDKRVTNADNETLKRTTTKAKAKVSLKSRGDFLINEAQPTTNISRAAIIESKNKKKVKNNSINITTRKDDNVISLISDLKITIKKSYTETLNNVTRDLKQSLTFDNINAIQSNKVNESDKNLNKSKNTENATVEVFQAIESENTETVSTSNLRNQTKTGGSLKIQKENCSPNRQTTSKFEKKKKKVSFDDISQIRVYEIDSKNTLKKLKGKDAPIPADKLPSKKSMETNCPKIEDFLLRIFGWNPVWLEEQKHLQQMPPIVNENELHPMLTFYKSYHDYYKIAEPLLLLEIWYGITKDFETIEKNSKQPTIMCSILEHTIKHNHVPSVNMYSSTLTVQVLVTQENLHKQVHPKYGDLVFFEYVKNENGNIIFHKIFAYVTNMYQTIIKPFTEYNKDLEHYVKKPFALLTYTLITKKLEENLVVNRVQRIRTVTYLRSNMRMIQAIQYLPQTSLLNLILQPKVEAYQLPEVETRNYQLITKDQLNEKQLEAVTRVTEAVIQEGAKICCIQGPPGTGKSKVIVNIVTEILYGNNRYENNKAPLRILVCAPSNAAIDEIVLRLLAIRATIKQKRFKMVRIGRPETMHQTVKDISLTELGKRDVKRVTESYLSKNIPIDSIEEEKLFLEARINALKCEILNSQKVDDTYKKHLKMKLADMTTKYELLQNHRSMNEMSTAELAKLQRLAERRILEGADIITCTLSSCYTNQMESIFSGNNKRISVCIVDEATQSCEAETLIPLLLGVNTLVLVGDPNQLPATVISQEAKRLGLDQSLFSRIQNALQGERNSPIIMLNTQYRMAHSIAYWPNKYFYGGRLKNAVKNVLTFPFHSYRVLNINANQNNDKFSNTNEAEFIANIILCMVIKSNLDEWKSNISIGVLTPYKNQRSLISKKITEKISTVSESIKRRFTIEINTVDSFQGQERDVILMSCVRSHGIGFLADRQRLCVALTRAKHTLILCGNFYTFMRDHTWNALILDAKSRGIYLNINANANLNEIKPHIVK